MFFTQVASIRGSAISTSRFYWLHCPVQFNLSQCVLYHLPVQMANKRSNLIILLPLVLVIPNLRPGNSLLLPSSSVCVNTILIQVSIRIFFFFFCFAFKQQSLFKILQNRDSIFNSISVFFHLLSKLMEESLRTP